MTWIDNNGEERPQSWEEYCEMRTTPRPTPKPLHVYEDDDNRGLSIRLRLFRANPHCFWCGRKTELNVLHASPELATVDHLYSRLHPLRPVEHRRRREGNVLHVLACYQCNHERGTRENQGRPFIPKLPERLEFAQHADATLANRSLRGTSGPEKPIKPLRVICTMEEAIKFARENPAR